MNFRLIQQALVALEMYREYTPEGNGVAEQAIVALKQFKKEWEETEVPYVVVECNCSGKTTLFSPPQRQPLPKSEALKHKYKPHKKYSWFCADCGYAEHELLMHTAAHGIKGAA